MAYKYVSFYTIKCIYKISYVIMNMIVIIDCLLSYDGWGMALLERLSDTITMHRWSPISTIITNTYSRHREESAAHAHLLTTNSFSDCLISEHISFDVLVVTSLYQISMLLKSRKLLYRKE